MRDIRLITLQAIHNLSLRNQEQKFMQKWVSTVWREYKMLQKIGKRVTIKVTIMKPCFYRQKMFLLAYNCLRLPITMKKFAKIIEKVSKPLWSSAIYCLICLIYIQWLYKYFYGPKFAPSVWIMRFENSKYIYKYTNYAANNVTQKWTVFYGPL